MILKSETPPAWVDAVIDGFDEFLTDHAANERKASAMAMSLVAHYQDRSHLCEKMIDLALEELNHFRQVFRLIEARGLVLAADEKDPYVNHLRRHVRRGRDDYFLDRLLTGAVIEARGAERFALVGEHLEDESLATFYQTLARSEANHYTLFTDLANHYFDAGVVEARWQTWLELESEIMASLPIRPRLH